MAVAYVQASEKNNLQKSIDDATNRLGTTETDQSSICSVVY